MSKNLRIAVLIILLILIGVIFFSWTGKILPDNNSGIIIFTSLMMLSFVVLFLEHYFTTPTDIILSTVSILLLLSPIKDKLSNLGVWYNIFYFYNVGILILSLGALILLNKDKSQNHISNKISKYLNLFVTRFGNGRFLYFSLFILTTFFYVNNQSIYFLILIGYSLVIILIKPTDFLIGIIHKKNKTENDIGEIFGVLSGNNFLVKLFKNINYINLFDYVEFKYSMYSNNKVLKGMVLEKYFLNEEQWIKILSDKSINDQFKDVVFNDIKGSNIIYKINEEFYPEEQNKFVGIIDKKSNVSKIKFIYRSKYPILEGQLLELYVNNQKILYQVIQGTTEIEKLEDRNEMGYIVGDAVQLGIWNHDEASFEKYGWVPEINTPVYIAKNIEDILIINQNEYEIGKIPNSNYPVIINKNDAISHHMAILGVTGCGKSVFARNLIREIVKDKVKVICVDFTQENSEKFQDLKPKNIIPEDEADELFEAIDAISNEMEKFANQRNPETIENNENKIKTKLTSSIKSFLTSKDQNLTIFELPDTFNTTAIFEYTKWFFKILFEIARKEKNYGKRLCVVLEEAHTVIPEWNFIGVSEKKAQSLVNSIGQIALQGRKYNIGFIIIAQRTANVSKTVLTQCNSIVVFQEFDNTSKDFLSNYLGNELVEVLPNLKKRQAISVGKAFKSNVPLIFEIPELKDE